jgi:hypothetical protein
VRFLGVQGRTLAMIRGNTFVETPYQCDSDQIVYEQQRTLADWRAGVIPHAIEILSQVNRKFHAPLPTEAEVAPLMQRLLNRQL